MPRRKSKRIRKRSPRLQITATYYKSDHGKIDVVPDPWAAIDAIVQREVEPTGPEWFTAYQFADRYKVSVNRAHEILKGLTKAGKLRKWKGTSLTTHKTATKYAPA